MPSKNKQYNLVQSDDLDTRIPLMPEDAFQHGIPFNCKFIGSMDIPRPTSRVEIVAAMRRVRVEFKSKGVKKKKITVTVSTDGIKTTLRKKNRKRKKRNSAYVDVDGSSSMVVLSHPIYRIFYVSHDSQDVKIFSYIARETSSNVFHCCVFKASNKNQAMRIVRTVGQAFEVCHKLVGTAGEEDDIDPPEDSNVCSQTTDSKTSEVSSQNLQTIPDPLPASATSLVQEKPASSSSSSTPPVPTPHSSSEKIAVEKPKPQALDLNKRDTDLMNLATPTSSAIPTPTNTQSFFKEPVVVQPSCVQKKENNPNFAHVHEAQLLKEQLEQQTQNTRAALAQIQLLRDQLAAESAARIEAQARTHQLLIHNKELLDHLQTLVRHIQELESSGISIVKDRTNSIAGGGVTLPQLTPRSKIERWFSFVVPPGTNDDDYSAEEFESLDKAVKNLRLSRRTLLSNKESGFVSETNELETKQPRSSKRARGGNTNKRKNNKISIRSNHRVLSADINRLSSTSSWLRRVLRLKRSATEYTNHHTMEYFNGPTLHRVNSTKSRVSSL